MSVGLNLVATPNLDGQLADLKSRGLDPGKFTICAPSAGTPGAIKGIAGCRHYHRCIFKRKEFGAGKGHGVHNIPFFHDARDSPDGKPHATEGFTACTLFMQMYVPRMKGGQEAIDEGLDGEQIEVIMDQADPTKLASTIVETGFVRIDPLNPQSLYERRDVEKPVPKYKFPQEFEHKAISKVLDRRARRQRNNPNSESYVEPEPAIEEVDLTLGSEPAPGTRRRAPSQSS